MNHSLEAVVQRIIIVVEKLHDGGSPHNRAAGKSACQHLGKTGEVRSDSVQSLRSSGAESKSGYNLVEDQDHVVAGRDLPKSSEELSVQRNPAPGGPRRLENRAGNLFVRRKQCLYPIQIISGKRYRVVPDTRRYTQRAIRIKRRLKTVNQLIMPAMKMPFKAKDLVPAGVGASKPQSEESGFGP